MRALYIIQPTAKTHHHVKAAIEYGNIDTILLACTNVPGDDKQNPWWQKYDENVYNLRKYLSFAENFSPNVNVVPVVQWRRQWVGSEPASQRIKAVKDLLKASGCKGVMWDYEDYGEQEGKPAQVDPPKAFVELCQNNGIPVIGGTPNVYMDQLNGRWFTQDTYTKNPWYRVKPKAWKNDVDIIPGSWVEMVKDPIKHLKTMNKCYDGNFWIYSHTVFGQNIPGDPHVPYYIHRDLFPLSWWIEVGKIKK